MSSRKFLGPACALLGFAYVFFTLPLQFVAAQEQPDDVRAKDIRADDRFRVYANLLFEKYDFDDDGFLSQDEMSEMRRPPSDNRFDLDEDGQLSLNELVEAIRRPSSATVEEKTPDQDQDDPDYAKATKYASTLIRQYDLDKDGFIDLAERKKMRRAFPLDYDQNSDGKVSLKELADRLAGRLPADKPTDSPGPDDETHAKWNLDDINLRFLEASLRKNDKNRNGQLDPDEIAVASWSSPGWQDSDTNRDGILTRDEMQRRYEKMFAERLAQTSAKQKQTEQQQAIREFFLRQTQSAGGGSLASARARTRSSAPAARSSAPGSVEIELYLLRLPEQTSSSAMKNAVEALKKKSTEKTVDKVANVAKRLGITKYDQLTFLALDDQQTRISSGASIPVAISQPQPQRGRPAQVQNYDVGLAVEARAEIQADHVVLAVEIAKSDVIQKDDGDEDVASSISVVQWEYDSSVRMEKDEISVIGSSAGNQHWILVLQANQK